MSNSPNTRRHRAVCMVSLPLYAALWMTALPATAGVALPAVPSNVDCQFSSTAGTVCGLYLDFTGSASASNTAGQSFSYQPSWAYAPYRFADESPTDTSGGSLALLHATDFVTFGALKSQLAATSTTSGWTSSAPNASAVSSSNIGFQDRLTFNLAGAAPGTLGTVTMHMTVSGNVGASSASYPFTTSQATTTVSVNSISPISDSVAAYGDRPSSGGIPQVITFSLPVKFNAPDFTLLFVQMQTAVSTAALNQQGVTWAAAANSSFFNSVEWGGIDSVFDDQGKPVTGWSVNSASGFDYTRSYEAQAVPEPSAWALMSVGLLVLSYINKRSTIRS